MIRGTNTQFIFILPCLVSDISCAEIIFWQDGYTGPTPNRKLPIVKVLGEFDVADNSKEISVMLNQEETLRFTENRKGYTQLRAITKEDVAYASKKREFPVYPVQDDNIIDDDLIPTPEFDGTVVLNGGLIE